MDESEVVSNLYKFLTEVNSLNEVQKADFEKIKENVSKLYSYEPQQYVGGRPVGERKFIMTSKLIKGVEFEIWGYKMLAPHEQLILKAENSNLQDARAYLLFKLIKEHRLILLGKVPDFLSEIGKSKNR